jgi:hypothetical protein
MERMAETQQKQNEETVELEPVAVEETPAPAGEVVPLQPRASEEVAIFGDDPARAIEKIDAIANAVTTAIRESGWLTVLEFSTKGGGKRKQEHVNIEGWAFTGALAGLSAGISHTERVKIDNANGWRAHAVVRRNGVVVAEGFGLCMRSEDRWKLAEEHAIMSMAGTRARANALAGVLRFIVKKAGYDTTPAEEMDGAVEHERKRQTRTKDGADTKGRTKKKASEAQVKAICAVVEKLVAAEALPPERDTITAIATEYKIALPDFEKEGDHLREVAAQLSGGANGQASNLIDRLKAKEATL